MTAKQALRKLKKAGWTIFEGRRHTKASSPDGKITITIFRHKEDIPIGTLRAIESQSGVKMLP